jgi:sortase A
MNKKEKNFKRKNGVRAVVVIVFLLCLGLTVYPLWANYRYEKQQDQVLAEYEAAAGQFSKEEYSLEWEMAETYNQKQAEGIEISREEYEECLNINGDGVLGFLEIPKLGIKLPIYHGTEECILQKGLGHIPQTSLPTGGPGCHTGITGHSGLSDRKLLSDLIQMEPGDFFSLYILDQRQDYRVDRIETVLPSQTDRLKAKTGEDYVTLITCTPYGVNDHRLLVRGKRISEDERAREEEQEDPMPDRSSFWICQYLGAVGYGIVIFVIVVCSYLTGRQLYDLRAKRHQRQLGDFKMLDAERDTDNGQAEEQTEHSRFDSQGKSGKDQP